LPQPEGPDEHHELTALDREIDATEDRRTAELLLDSLERQGRHGTRESTKKGGARGNRERSGGAVASVPEPAHGTRVYRVSGAPSRCIIATAVEGEVSAK
jgi:hypothetical protein